MYNIKLLPLCDAVTTLQEHRLQQVETDIYTWYEQDQIKQEQNCSTPPVENVE